MLILTRVDFRRALSACLIAAASLIATSCARPGASAVNVNSGPDTANANTLTSNTPNSSSSFDGGKYGELLEKVKEMENLPLPVKLDPKAAIKGKVFFVESSEARARYADYDAGISDDRKARNLEELETLIRINCSKGKFLGEYSKRYSTSSLGTIAVKAYGINCQVSLVDYPARVVVAQKNFSNNEGGESLIERSVAGEHVNPPPVGQIVNYINSFQVDKVLPAMSRPDEKELVRLPVTVGLKPDAAMTGKIKIVQKLERGDLESYLHSFEISGSDNFGFPYERIAQKPEELETLIRIVCVRGSLIGRVEKTTQYSGRCEVSLIDYKTLSVFARKTIENKTLEDTGAAKSSESSRWVVGPPKQEIESYLKSFPGA
ncbi:MAG TPA: hypothetical protein VGW12_21425 [Pyrinomonadaceae bacterium]|nr:hypothetical protein [Pyrinomonadaceae bacterium]